MADSPAVITIGGVELLFVEITERFAEQRGHLGESLNGEAQIFGGDGFRSDEFADGVTRIARVGHEGTVAPVMDGWNRSEWAARHLMLGLPLVGVEGGMFALCEE